jgi:predicted DNA-binding transcriptional regulator AlpA
VNAVDHRFALSMPAIAIRNGSRSAILWVSAPSKKSFSSASSPIFACRAFKSTGGAPASPFSWPKTPAAPSSARLAAHYPDPIIAGVLNRQRRTSAYGHRFDANNVGNLRRHWKIPRFRPSPEPAEGELMTVRKAAAALGVAPSTIHRSLNDGAIVGEQFTAGAPWRIRLTNELRARFVDDAPSDYVTMCQAMRRLGVSRQTVWQRVKRGELEALHVTRGRQKGLRIKVMHPQSGLFDQLS